jgi:hypothetical protein
MLLLGKDGKYTWGCALRGVEKQAFHQDRFDG